MLNEGMQRRAHDRISVNLEAKLNCGTRTNNGVVRNISEKGMLIVTKLDFPFDICFDLLLPSTDEILNVPVKICRLERSKGDYDRIGVEVTDFLRSYLDYVSQLRASINGF